MIRTIEREHHQPPGWWSALERWQQAELMGEYLARAKARK